MHVYTLPSTRDSADKVPGQLNRYYDDQDRNFKRTQLHKNNLRITPEEQRFLHFGLFTDVAFYRKLQFLANETTCPLFEIVTAVPDIIPRDLQDQRRACLYPEFLDKLLAHHKALHAYDNLSFPETDVPEPLRERVKSVNMRDLDEVQELIDELQPHKPTVAVLDLHALGSIPSLYTKCESSGFHMVWELNQAPTRTGEVVDPYSLQQVYPASAIPEMSTSFAKYGHPEMVSYAPLNMNVDNCGECANCLSENQVDDLYQSNCLNLRRYKINVTGYANTEISQANVISIQYTLSKAQSDPNRIVKITRELEHNEGLHNLIALALNKLNLGGTCIFHLHGTFLPATLALLAYLSSIFRTVKICKPLTLRADSSVCIVVCLDLLQVQEHPLVPISPDYKNMWYKGAISQEFLDTLVRITKELMVNTPNAYLTETVQFIRKAKQMRAADIEAMCAPRNQMLVQTFGREYFKGQEFPSSNNVLTGVIPIGHLPRQKVNQK